MHGSSYRAVLPLFVLLGGIAADSWLVYSAWGFDPWIASRETGYAISLLALITIAVYAVFDDTVPSLDLERLPMTFLALLGGYWVVLGINYAVTRRHAILPYFLLTPIVVYVTVVLLPQFIREDRRLFTQSLSSLAALLTIIGLAMLAIENVTEDRLWVFVGQDVMIFEGIRTSSIFAYSDTYGFMMMVGSLTALFTYFNDSNPVWIGITGINVFGLFLSEADASYVAFGVGGLMLLSVYNLRYAVVFFFSGLILTLFMWMVGHIPAHFESGFNERLPLWQAALQRLADDPLFGIGFTDVTTEIDKHLESRGPAGPHNSYIHILLNTGVIAGLLYFGAILYTVIYGFTQRWTLWQAYAVAILMGTLIVLMFETTTLGGLSTMSLILGLYIGLVLESDNI